MMGIIILMAFLAGSVFMSLLVWVFLIGAHDDDPMDEAEANAPRDCFSCCNCGSSIDSSKLLPRREVKPSGRKHFVED